MRDVRQMFSIDTHTIGRDILVLTLTKEVTWTKVLAGERDSLNRISTY